MSQSATAPAATKDVIADEEFTTKRLALEKLVKEQAELVCNLKAASDTKPDVLAEAVGKLRDLKDEQKKLVSLRHVFGSAVILHVGGRRKHVW